MLLKLIANAKIAKNYGNGGIPSAYANFDLLIHRSGGKYTARVINSLAGESSTEIVPPTSVVAPQELFADLNQTAPREHPGRAAAQKAIRTLGESLFDAVFAGAIRGCLQSSLDEAKQKGQGLRIRLRLVDTPELAALPWELLYNSALDQFLSLSVKTPVVRYLDLPASPQPWEVKPPLRVLVMISNPVDYPRLQVEREWSKLKEAFQGLENRGLAQLECLEEATLEALQKRLQGGEYHIFHFIGHGVFDRKAQDGLLILENEDERGEPVNGERLGVLLHDHPSLRLALLNACEGARCGSCDTFTGLAQRFVQQGLPAVIAMQFPVSDETAITLSHVFYEILAQGHPVDAALTEARKAVFTQVNEAEWAAPVLFMRSPDGRIFDFAPARGTMPLHAATVPAPTVAPPRKSKLLPIGIALAAILLVFAAYRLISKPASPPTSPKVVAVLPFAVTGSEEYAAFGKGMVDLLSTNLDGADELRCVDPRALLSYVVKKHDAEFAPEQCSKIAARFGAGLFVLGNITEARGRLRIHATLYECNNGPQILAQAQVEGEPAFEIETLRVFTLQDKPQQQQMLQALRQRHADTVLRAAWNLAVYCGDLPNAENVARLLTLPARSQEVRPVGHVLLAHLALAQGRWRAAQMELAKAEQLDRATGIEYRALLSATPFLPVSETNLAAIRASVERLGLVATVSAAPAPDYLSVHDDLHPHLRSYLLGLLSIRLGQSEAAIACANNLEQLGGAPVAVTLAGDLSQSLHAQVARSLAPPADALILLEQNKMESSYELAVASPFYAQVYERYLRATLLQELGRLDEALNWYNSFGEFSVYDLVYLAPSHLQRGGIYETMGEHEQAIQHYTRFIALWQNCDPELKPMVTEAETRLAQLQ